MEHEFIILWFYHDHKGRLHQMITHQFADNAQDAIYEWACEHLSRSIRPWWLDYGVVSVSKVVDDWTLPVI